MRVKRFAIIGLILAAVVATACSWSPGGNPAQHIRGADAARGEQAIERYGCGSCHTIPGIRGARAVVGPPLNAIGRRRVIAGRLPNTPGNLAQWIQHPQEIDPGVVMPDLGVTDREARDIAEYLLQQR